MRSGAFFVRLQVMSNGKKRTIVVRVVVAIGGVLFLTGLWQSALKPLPSGIHTAGHVYAVPAQTVHFLADRTFVTVDGTRQSEQEIFDTVLRMINGAQSYVLIDMFLFNDFLGTATHADRQLARELTDALIAKKVQNPAIVIQFITDPINTVYGGDHSVYLDALRAAGITVITTDLRRLRDSNVFYSALWRVFAQWWGNSAQGGWIPHVLDRRRHLLTLRTYLIMLNFKANHRKIVVADVTRRDGTRGMRALVTSANPHDGSSAHSNSALVVDALLWRDVVRSEAAVAAFSGTTLQMPIGITPQHLRDSVETVSVQLLTEGAIRTRLIREIDQLDAGDHLDLAMFYCSERSVIRALKRAARRGVAVRLILDPNRDAFGREKNGIPNRQVAAELQALRLDNVQMRWCDTHGEQCHSKLVIMRTVDGRSIVLLGSANLTRRNIDDYNLEADVIAVARDGVPRYLRDAQAFFDQQWRNEGGHIFTAPYEKYRDERIQQEVLYRAMEFTGMSSF